MYGGQASLGRACADLFQQARLNTDCKINFPGWVGVGVVGLTENKATQPSLAGAWAELGKRLKEKNCPKQYIYEVEIGANNGQFFIFF